MNGPLPIALVPVVRQIEDPKFGTLTLCRATVPVSWFGRYHFCPEEREVDVRIPVAGFSDGPSSSQRNWLQALETKWGLVTICVLKPLQAAVHHYLGGQSELRNLLDEFSLTAIFAPLDPASARPRYEFSFVSASDPELRLVAMFNGHLGSPSPVVRVRGDRDF